MKIREGLRRAELREASLEHCLRRVAGSKIVSIDNTRRYLCLSLTDEAGNNLKGWMDVDAWGGTTASRLPGVAWEQIPLSYLARWLLGNHHPCLIAGKAWTLQQVDIPTTSLPKRLVHLPSDLYTFFCQAWPHDSGKSSSGAVQLAQFIPFVLRYVLGYSQLSLQLLLTVAEGDLIRIENYDPLLAIGRYPLFHFCLTEDLEVFVEEQFDMSEYEKCRGEEETLFEWSNLPVDIEFVLADMTLSIGELDGLQPGAQLPLYTDAEKKIKIYLNRKLFARGELILLDNGSLAVEVNQLNNVSPEQIGFSHAE